jgi:ribokinase
MRSFLCVIVWTLIVPNVSCNILVIGSVNADTFLPVQRLPKDGENLSCLRGEPIQSDVPGGKGCTQAVAAAKLVSNGRKVYFCGQFGGDDVGKRFHNELLTGIAGSTLDLWYSRIHPELQTGRGYVFRTPEGSVSAVISGGANQDGWNDIDELLLPLQECQSVMLQCEVPDEVNRLILRRVQQLNGGGHNITVFLDVGGEDRPMDEFTLRNCQFLTPNLTELKRLVSSSGYQSLVDDLGDGDEHIVQMARFLQSRGAQNVLVTRGSRGATLVTRSTVWHQPACPARVTDETGAGDCFRAAFCAFSTQSCEHEELKNCLAFAAAAGACAVESRGAVPSTPTLAQVLERMTLAPPARVMDEAFSLSPQHELEQSVLNIPRGEGYATPLSTEDYVPSGGSNEAKTDFPFLIGSRLNSMKDRADLWPQSKLETPRDYVLRQATVSGITCVDFNYPQHFSNYWSVEEAKKTLEEVGLVAGAVCLRYPVEEFARGAMNHPDPLVRQRAIDLTKEAARAALDLGCREVVVWSAFDGYDYPFQVDYDKKWNELVGAFQECCDAFPDVKFSLEYKPTDENTRFFTVPSTGAALLLVHEIDRPNVSNRPIF